MAALIRVAFVAALAACVSKPTPPGDKGAARSWHERADHPAPGEMQPDQLQAPRLVYDPRRERVLLYGGHLVGQPVRDSMFELDPDSGWKVICTRCLETADPVIGMGGRNLAALVYDPINERVLLFGGDHDGGELFNDLWALYGDQWSLVPLNGGMIPSKRTQNQIVFEPTERKLWLLGGYAMSNPLVSDTYFLDAQGVWSKAPNPDMPVVMASPGIDSVYDPQRQRVLLMENANTPSSELWEYASNHWQMISEHSSMTDRQSAVMVHVPDYDQTFLIGGYRNAMDTQPIAGTEILIGDRFETYDAMLPPPRASPGIAYDPSRDVVVMYGGQGPEDGADCNANRDCGGTWELQRD